MLLACLGRAGSAWAGVPGADVPGSAEAGVPGLVSFTGCSRPARETDFEHATPYDKGGRTDFCNAGARSRRCHRVKQIPGWAVIQPQPGWHTWTVPSGRTYTKAPKRYPA